MNNSHIPTHSSHRYLDYVEKAAAIIATPGRLTTLFILAICGLLLLNHATTPPFSYPEFTNGIPEWKKMSIEMLVSRSEIMSSWAMAILASLGFIFNYIRDRGPFSFTLLLVGFFSFIMGFASVCLSYLQFDVVIRPLLVGEDPTQGSSVFALLRAQFWTLLFCVIAFVSFVLYLSFREVIQKADKSRIGEG